MKIKHFIIFVCAIAALTLIMSGCGSSELDMEGKYVVTFELCGGTLDYGTSMVSTNIKYVYEPNTYIFDPTTKFSDYQIYRNGYVFTGWYTGEDCKPSEKWNFENNLFNTPTLTLYAGWEKAISYSYSIYYTDENGDVLLGKYSVKSGEKFDDYRGYADNRDGYTSIGYYADRELTQPWDHDATHPGGETDLDIPVFVDYIVGEWSLVDSVDALKTAVDAGENVYLTKDIDVEGAELSFSGTYNGTFEGNGYSISNFTVEKSGGALIPSCSIFNALGENAIVKNVSFKNVTYRFMDIGDNARTVKVAALAKTASGSTVENVSVEGKIITNYVGELTQLESAFYEGNGTESISGFTANITVDKQS